jgi:hypothetical protein
MPPTDAQIDEWATSLPHAGVGLAYGPDGVIAIDLDFLDPATAQETCDLTTCVFGATPLVRIGKAPKKLLLFLRAPDLVAPAKNFGGFEVFSRSGQTVLFGRHPEGFSYHWIGDTPETTAPDLPEIDAQGFAEWLDAMQPYRRNLKRKRPPKTPANAPATTRTASDVASGAVAEVLPRLRATTDPLAEAARLVAEAAEGSRYPTAFGAVMGLAHLGFSNADIRDAIFDLYLRHFDNGEERCHRRKAITTALAYARREIGPDDKAILSLVPTASIAKAWKDGG